MYGLNEYERNKAIEKINSVKLFLQSNGIEINGKNIPFANFFKNSFVNPDRYIAEINHRVYSLFEYAQEKGLSNVFCTLTAPTEYHPTRTLKNGKSVVNSKYGGRPVLFIRKHPLTGKKIMIFNPESNRDLYKPREASKVISKMMQRIVNDRVYRSIALDSRVYFRVTEPHKDGCPHVHVSFFIPDEYVDAFKSLILRFFPEPRAKVEINVENPVSYLMKYILKTLDDLRGNDNNLTDLSLWYVYHGISRIYTSRTFVSLDIYRCLGGRYNLTELSNKYNDGLVSVIVDKLTKKVECIYDENYMIYSRKVVKVDVASKKSYEKVPTEWTQKTKNDFIPLVIDDKNLLYKDGKIFEPASKSPLYMKNYELYHHFLEIDKNIDTVNLHHYGLVKNELINRGMLIGETLPIDSYNGSF